MGFGRVELLVRQRSRRVQLRQLGQLIRQAYACRACFSLRAVPLHDRGLDLNLDSKSIKLRLFVTSV
jgi:hypothetical protein